MNKERNDIARQLARLADEVKDMTTGFLFHRKVYNNAELMKLLGVSTATLKKWRNEGRLSYTQVGDKFYYSSEDVDAFLKNNHNSAYLYP